jgi:hypothetical protein
MNITCTRFKSYEAKHLRGFADIFVEDWGIEIPGFTLYMKDGQRWVNLPGQEYVDKEGIKKHKPIFFFKEKERWEPFKNAVRDAIDRFNGSNNQVNEEKPILRDFYEKEDELPF